MESRPTELFTQSLDQNFVCSICLNVMGNPCDTPCHHTFCFDCITAAIKANGLCPECRQPIAVKRLHPSPFKFKSVLHNQITICDSENEGKKCEWTGEWSNLTSHLKNDCAFVKVPCTFECGKEILRCNLQEHESNQCPNRNTACMYCKEEINKLSLKKHYEECSEATVKCKCKGKFLRKELANHQALVCQETVIPCLFSRIGCTFQVERKHLADHLQTSESQHATLLNKKLSDEENLNSVLNETVKQLEKKIKSTNENLSRFQKENVKISEDAFKLKYENTGLLKQLQQEKESRKKEAEDIMAVRTETKSQVEQAEKEVQKHLQGKELLGKQNNELKAALFELEEDVKLLRCRNSELQSNLETAHQQQQQDNQKMREEHGKLLQKYQQNKENFEKQNSESTKVLMEKEKELKDLLSSNKFLQSEIDTLKLKNKNQLDEFKKRLDSTTQANEAKMKLAQEELCNLREKNFDLLSSKTNLLVEQKQERESLENQKSELKTLLSEMEQELEKMRSFNNLSQPQEKQTQFNIQRYIRKYYFVISLLLWIYIAIKV